MLPSVAGALRAPPSRSWVMRSMQIHPSLYAASAIKPSHLLRVEFLAGSTVVGPIWCGVHGPMRAGGAAPIHCLGDLRRWLALCPDRSSPSLLSRARIQQTALMNGRMRSSVSLAGDPATYAAFGQPVGAIEPWGLVSLLGAVDTVGIGRSALQADPVGTCLVWR